MSRADARFFDAMIPGALVKFADPQDADEEQSIYIVRDSWEAVDGIAPGLHCNAFPAMGWTIEPLFTFRAVEMKIVGQMAVIK